MSTREQVDLAEIYEYIASGNPIAADTFLTDLTQTIGWMAEIGLTGVPRSFAPGLRAFVYRERCIYFTIDDEILTVARVLHGKRNVTVNDFSSQDFPESEI